MSFSPVAVATKRAKRLGGGLAKYHPGKELRDVDKKLLPHEFKSNCRDWLLALAQDEWKGGCVPQDGTSPTLKKNCKCFHECFTDEEFGSATLEAVAEWMLRFLIFLIQKL